MEFNRCYACMRELDQADGICPDCGFDNTAGPASQPDYVLRCGSVLAGRYVVGKVLGQGGFGITYIAWNLLLEIPVCIKEYYPSGAAMRSSSRSGQVIWSGGESAGELKNGRESFVREARKAARLRDLDSVVKVWDVFYENDTAYIVMNYLEGETLKSMLARRGRPLDEKECAALLIPVVRDLEEVHKREIIHRDISPDNLLLRRDGKLVLLDLGAAKDLSSSRMSSYLVAKQGFSPLEQYIRSGDIGPWTDVYAMCATLYYAVSGSLLPTPMERMVEDKVSFACFSPTLAEILKKGLAIKAADRIQNMGELLTALERLNTETETRKKENQDERMSDPPRGRLPLILGIAAAVLLLFAGARLLLREPVSPTPAPAVSPAVTASLTPSPTPSQTPTPSPTPSPSPTPTPTPTPTLSPSPSPAGSGAFIADPALAPARPVTPFGILYKDAADRGLRYSKEEILRVVDGQMSSMYCQDGQERLDLKTDSENVAYHITVEDGLLYSVSLFQEVPEENRSYAYGTIYYWGSQVLDYRAYDIESHNSADTLPYLEENAAAIYDACMDCVNGKTEGTPWYWVGISMESFGWPETPKEIHPDFDPERTLTLSPTGIDTAELADNGALIMSLSVQNCGRDYPYGDHAILGRNADGAWITLQTIKILEEQTDGRLVSYKLQLYKTSKITALAGPVPIDPGDDRADMDVAFFRCTPDR